MSFVVDPAVDRMARDLGEVVDHFLTVPFCLTGGPSAFADRPIINKLYGAARKLTGDLPLCYSAARALLDRVPMGGRVIIGTRTLSSRHTCGSKATARWGSHFWPVPWL